MLARSDIERAREVWREIQSRISAANNRDACPAGCVPLPAAKTSLGSQLRADLLDEFQGFTKAMRRQYGGNIDIPQWIGLFPPGQAMPLENGASSHQWVAQQIETGFHDKPQFAIEPAKWEEIHVKVAAHVKDVERWFIEGIEQTPGDVKDGLGKIEIALAMLVRNPELSLSELAEQVQVHPKTMYKPAWKPVRDAKNAMKSPGSSLRRGEKYDGRLEATHTEEIDVDD